MIKKDLKGMTENDNNNNKDRDLKAEMMEG